ncbi:MAG TPA: excinuclease ABC subunit UvrB, partial [Thermopetrobacter sp.]|nr:excinuclease ABC subunit UvrB [Thermopetrobacter sp.]
TPETVKKSIHDIIETPWEADHVTVNAGPAAEKGALAGKSLEEVIEELEKRMYEAAANLEFEEAARLRDEVKRLRDQLMQGMEGPLATPPQA